jgi:hypothetical protein
MNGVYDLNLKVWRYDINEEDIATQRSLKDAQKSKPAPHSETLAAFMKLDPKRAKLTPKHIDDLQKALRAHHGDGVGDVASGNRDGLKNNAAHNAGSLEAIKKDFKKYAVGCSEDFPDKLMEHYIECTEAGARNVILELLSNNPELRLAFASQAVEAENAELREEYTRAEMQAMYEEVIFDQPSRSTNRRRSLDTDFDAPSEDNRALYEETPRSHLDPAMAKRASYLNSTAGRTDVVRDKNYLTETWDLQRKI